MPKLPKKMQAQVNRAPAITGDSGFPLLEPGKYLARLEDVEAKQSRNGNPIWSVVFDNLRTLEGEELPGKQFYNLNLPTSPTPPDGWKAGEQGREDKWTRYQERCAGQVHGFFEVFGYTVDSDTDEMLGEDCVLIIGVRTAQEGPKKGERQNEVRGLESVDEADLADDADDSGF